MSDAESISYPEVVLRLEGTAERLTATIVDRETGRDYGGIATSLDRLLDAIEAEFPQVAIVRELQEAVEDDEHAGRVRVGTTVFYEAASSDYLRRRAADYLAGARYIESREKGIEAKVDALYEVAAKRLQDEGLTPEASADKRLIRHLLSSGKVRVVDDGDS